MTKKHRPPPSLLPCPTCPWRRDQTRSAIPRYNHDKACNLLNTTVGEGDALRQIMACHGSTGDNMRPCNGYLARAGWSNINVRILLHKGQIANPTAVADACAATGVKLHRTYAAVLAKLKRGLRSA